MAAKLKTTVSTKGQVILPKSVRDALKWTAGTRLTVEETADGVVLRADAPFEATRPQDVFGMLRYDGPAKTVDEMNAAIAEEARRRHASGRY